MQTNEHSDAPTEILITKTGSEPDSVHGLYFSNSDLEQGADNQIVTWSNNIGPL